MRRSLPLLLTAAVLAVVSACSAPPAGQPVAPPAAPVKPAVEDAVRSYTAAFLSGQGEKAASMLSARCDTPTLRQQTVQASKMAPALYGQARLVSVVPTVDGDHATVTYRFDQPAIDQEGQPWVFEDGAWRYDKC